jgi:betaine-aldehyde dehydrogenase
MFDQLDEQVHSDGSSIEMRTEMFSGGQWRTGRGAVTSVINPATGDVLAAVNAATVADVDDAVQAAAVAAADPRWRSLLPHERARYLHEIAARIEAGTDRLATIQTLNTGKTLAETSALVRSAAGTFRYFAAVAETMQGELTPPRGPYLSLSTYEPIGVIGAITPWNSPIASDAQKIAPALAAGNAVVVKPADWTPLVSLALAELISETSLPRGLVSVVTGPGSVVGDALVKHPLIGKVTFTGGTATGRAIGAIAAQRIIPTSLELGGKSPTIVFDDADIDLAVEGIVFGMFSSSGQSCIAGSRLFIDRTRYDEVLARVVERVAKLSVGNGLAPGTDVGPLVHPRHRDQVAAYVDLARSEGGSVLIGGGPPAGPGYATGSYYLPTVIDGLANKARTCREEIFGPVLVAMPFDGEDDVVRQANDNDYGLACGLWTRDYQRALRVGRRIESGTIWINTYKKFSISTPFGGMKESGLGREKGIDGLRASMRQKSFYLGLDSAPPHRWYA